MTLRMIASHTRRFIGLSWIAAILVCLAYANQAVVTHRATLRKDPSTAHAPIAVLVIDDEVEVIDNAQSTQPFPKQALRS